ncbi:hypothetical protein POM88_025530 [Heracleum sosnowskyi]|uniref:SWIM-type domain-containing protein n=1 Tax=Heracleum sosnowskyi TaxID=360622 RepID=A0AAD8I4B8_9APIA|nr:hypothetical protein POM88_025530 [Heracleum sosnowskyi]
MITTDLIKIADNQGSVCGGKSRLSCEDSSDASTAVCSTESEGSVNSYMLSPGGRRYFKPTVDASRIPFRGQVFETLEKGCKFYTDYGGLSGFDIRKTTEKRTEDKKTVILKHYVCNREGFNDVDLGSSDCSGSKEVQGRRTMSRRCGCKAKFVLKITSVKTYYVFSFVELHNHPLVSESGRHFLKVNRKMTVGLRNIVFDSSKVNIGPSKAFCFAKELYGGYANVGATLCDFRNCDRDLKLYVGERDGQMMIDKFKVMQETCKSFYYAYDVDSDGHLTKLFWADAVGRRNFELYGDAVSFDATFDTNKYNMIFAPFTGVDKHDKCVTFAACLLSQESVTDYSWAFSHFVKAMGRNPVVIVTDQCAAMKVAIRDTFVAVNGLVASKHRLCMWHIMDKFPMKLGNRLCKETDFMEKMKTYVWSSIIEIDEFEAGWIAIINEFKLEDNKWLSDMYAIRSCWIPAYFRNEPMFGLMRTTSRSESENFFFSQFHKQGDTLCEFWLRFQSAMDRQRNETVRLDNESNSSLPVTLSTWFIEDDAANLFTRAIFYKLQEEIMACCYDMQIKRMSEEVDGVTHFEIRDVKVMNKLFKVSVSRNHAVCSCNKFVMCGIVCRHAFCGLKQIGVIKFPKTLVLNRWMKIAESGTSSISVSVSNDCLKMERASLKMTEIWFDFRQAVNKAGVQADRLDYVHKTVKQLNAELDNQSGDFADFTKKDHMAAMLGPQPVGELTILVPKNCKNKGNYFKKRLVSEREKALNKSKKRIRKCKKCEAVTHDARTCPLKKEENAKKKGKTEAHGDDSRTCPEKKQETPQKK